jgi:hypothetical protein
MARLDRTIIRTVVLMQMVRSSRTMTSRRRRRVSMFRRIGLAHGSAFHRHFYRVAADVTPVPDHHDESMASLVGNAYLARPGLSPTDNVRQPDWLKTPDIHANVELARLWLEPAVAVPV